VPFYISEVKAKLPPQKLKQMVCSELNKVAHMFGSRREWPCAQTLIVQVPDAIVRAKELDLKPMVRETTARLAGAASANEQTLKILQAVGINVNAAKNGAASLAMVSQDLSTLLGTSSTLAVDLTSPGGKGKKASDAAQKEVNRAMDAANKEAAAKRKADEAKDAAAKRAKGPQDAAAQAKGKLSDTLSLLKAMDAQMRSDGVTGTWPCFSKMAEGTCRFRQCKRCEAGATWDKVADKDKVRAIIKAALSKSAPNSEAVRFAEALAKKAA